MFAYLFVFRYEILCKYKFKHLKYVYFKLSRNSSRYTLKASTKNTL